MSSRFVSWEVEGEDWKRLNGALQTVEQERLARAVDSAETERAPASVPSAIYAGLERLGKRICRLRAEARG